MLNQRRPLTLTKCPWLERMLFAIDAFSFYFLAFAGLSLLNPITASIEVTVCFSVASIAPAIKT